MTTLPMTQATMSSHVSVVWIISAASETVTDIAGRSGGGQGREVIGHVRVNQPLYSLDRRDAGTDEDGGHDEKPGAALGTAGPEQEGDAERHCGERVSEVVDQIGKQ